MPGPRATPEDVAALLACGLFVSDRPGLYVLPEHARTQAELAAVAALDRRRASERGHKARQRSKVSEPVFTRDGRRCTRCGAADDLTVDHRHPRVRGGGNETTNLQTLCRSCNSRKGASLPGTAQERTGESESDARRNYPRQRTAEPDYSWGSDYDDR